MSTLTKVLIVLLTVFSIFLCGIVVTYVSNAENQKERADGLQRNIQSARRSEEDALRQLEEKKQEFQNDKARLDTQIADLGRQIQNLQGELDAANRERSQFAQRVDRMAATVETANAASKQQTSLFETTQQEVQRLRTEQADSKKEIDETNQMLLDKMAVIADLEARVRRLTEENQETLSQLNRQLQPYGQTANTPRTTVAPRNATAQPMQPATMTPSAPTRAINLNGQVTDVDLTSRLAVISLGTASGVRQEMTFHVTRGDQWVANIAILEAWPDKAVGRINLVQPGMEPRVGDRVATNL